MATQRKQAPAKASVKSDPVVRFRILTDELDRCRQLAAWREKPDVSAYLRHLLDQEWCRYQRAHADRAA